MKARSLFLLTAIFCMVGNSPLFAADPVEFDTSPYQYQREVIGNPTGDSLGTLALDAEIYRLSGLSHENLRLVKKDGGSFSELPWIIEASEREVDSGGEQFLPHSIESFDENDDGSIELTVILRGNTPPPARLEILTPLRDFEKSVTVSSSRDGTTWSPLISNVLVFDYGRFLDFRRTSLSLPESGSRRFKVRISNATDQQRSLVKELSKTVSDTSGVIISESETQQTRLFRIDEIRFFSAATRNLESGQERSYELKILEQKSIPNDKTTQIEIDGGGLPLCELILSTKDRNFRREIHVQTPDLSSSGAWRTIHRSSIHCYRVGDFREERLSLKFEEVRSDRYRFIINNEDSPSLTISGVTGKGDLYELLFLAEPGDHCFLFLGAPSESMAKPRFDTAAISAAKGRKVPRQGFEPGALEENGSYVKETKTDSRILESKALLWSIIAAVVALLIIVLYRTLQRVEVMEEGD